jgi:REP element-mobilizing transposase RayT
MKTNFINSDHVHVLLNLPTNKTVEEVLKLLKGGSSHWINKSVNYKFSWGIGYGAFSISDSNLETVTKYIKQQEEHHRKKSFSDELDLFRKMYRMDILNN